VGLDIVKLNKLPTYSHYYIFFLVIGRIVFVSSQAGQTGLFGYSGYSASKFALRGFAVINLFYYCLVGQQLTTHLVCEKSEFNSGLVNFNTALQSLSLLQYLRE